MLLSIQPGLTSVPVSNPLEAVNWVEGLITGTAGTILAVIAVAWLGYSMLAGNISLRRGGAVVMGCFIIFAAPTIARGLIGNARTAENAAPPPVPLTITPPPPAVPPPPPYDPYAGAAVPTRQ